LVLKETTWQPWSRLSVFHNRASIDRVNGSHTCQSKIFHRWQKHNWMACIWTFEPTIDFSPCVLL
jgi:hypothetical protein